MSNGMKKGIGAVIIIALVAIMVGSFMMNKFKENKITAATAGPKVATIGEVAPDFTLQTLDGKSVTLSELKGKKVVLNFWATWCPPCKEEMPHFQTYYEQYKEEDNVEIIAVNITYKDYIDKVGNFVETNSLTFPILLMEEDDISKAYKIFNIPSTFMINTKGEIEKQIVGPLDGEKLRDYVTNLE